MKKIFLIIAIIVCLVVLSRCANNHSEIETTYQEITVENNLQEEEISNEEEITYSFEYSDVHFTHSPNNFVKIDITYPQFKDERLANLNAKIDEYAKSNFISIMNEEDLDEIQLTLEETFSVKLANENMVSIYQSGEIIRSDAAHPLALKGSLNIHPFDLRKFKITELIDINDEFVQKFKEAAQENEQLVAYLSSFSDEQIKDYLINSGLYYDDKDTIIIFEVSHALGDFIEVKI